jgi:hypothetical protein
MEEESATEWNTSSSGISKKICLKAYRRRTTYVYIPKSLYQDAGKLIM